MLLGRIFLVCCLSNIVLCENDEIYITSKAYGNLTEGEEPIAIYYYNKYIPRKDVLEAVTKSIKSSIGYLKKHNLPIAIADCSKEQIPGCEATENFHRASVFREGRVLSVIHGDSFLTPMGVKAYIRHNIAAAQVQEILDEEHLEKIKQEQLFSKDSVILFIPSTGSVEHLKMLELADQIPEEFSMYYTLNINLFPNDNKVLFLSCVVPENNACEVTSYPSVKDKTFSRKMEEASLVTVLPPGKDFSTWLDSILLERKNVLVFIAGKGKLTHALPLAKKAAMAMKNEVPIVVVDGTMSLNPYFQPRIENGKIFALVARKSKKAVQCSDIGYLLSDNLDHLRNDFEDARAAHGTSWQKLSLYNANEEDPENHPRPHDLQDDPMAFSIHNSPYIRKLYYIDYKTLPRLTDVTYAEVTNSKKYAVILFTLEFNPRALAALVTFAEIHKDFKEKKMKSPMYRVECYNWPDICEKAGVHTSPRMFFYPPGSTDRIEYTGIWDKASINDNILRYSQPSVIVVKKKEHVLPYNPMTSRALIGFFKSDEGTDVFRKAAEMVQKDYQFIAVHGSMAATIAKEYNVGYSHKTLIAFENSEPKEEAGTFTTENDILNYLKSAFKAPPLQELTIYSYIEVLKDSKPLFIYFWNNTDDNKSEHFAEIKDMVQEIASNKILAEKILFTWMNSSSYSIGSYVLEQYNKRAKLEEPIVAFFDKKGSVMLTSCGKDCKRETLLHWLTDCLQGKVTATYTLNNEEWKPRLDGYDYLEIMKTEGTYPMNRRKLKSAEEDETTTSSQSGRHIGAAKHKKEDDDEEGENEDGDEEGENEDGDEEGENEDGDEEEESEDDKSDDEEEMENDKMKKSSNRDEL